MADIAKALKADLEEVCLLEKPANKQKEDAIKTLLDSLEAAPELTTDAKFWYNSDKEIKSCVIATIDPELAQKLSDVADAHYARKAQDG